MDPRAQAARALQQSLDVIADLEVCEQSHDNTLSSLEDVMAMVQGELQQVRVKRFQVEAEIVKAEANARRAQYGSLFQLVMTKDATFGYWKDKDREAGSAEASPKPSPKPSPNKGKAANEPVRR